MWKHEKFRFLEAPDGKELTLANDTVVCSLEDLCEAMNKIDPDTFYQHVGDGRNDFADWVDDVFGLTDLAEKYRRHPTPLRMMVHLEAFLRT